MISQRDYVQRQAGVTLLELMIALALGVFLVAGVIQVFLTTKRSTETENSLARLQENGRAALDLITDDLRKTQYLGCNTGDSVLKVMATNSNFEGVRGYERTGGGSWAALPTLPTRITAGGANAINAVARPGSDVVSMQMGLKIETNLTASVDPTSTTLAIDDNPSCALVQGDQIILASCVTAHLMEITNDQSACDPSVSPNTASLQFDNTANTLISIDAPYDTSAELMAYEDRTWYVADTGRDILGADVYALYRDVNGSKQEIIEGVEYMQIQFGQRVKKAGVFDPNDPTARVRYVDPSDATLNASDNYDGVNSVRVALLMQSFQNVQNTPDQRSYTLLGVTIGPPGGSAPVHGGGKIQRRIFSTAVALRNPIDFQ